MYRETLQSERLYGKIASRYDTVFERAILSESRVTELAQRFLNGRSVLDLACGNGRWLSRFAPSHYVGLDLNREMLDQAARQHRGEIFIQGDMTRLPFPEATFEGVLSMFGAIGHLPLDGQRRMIAEIRRVLAPGGIALVTNGNLWSPFNLPNALLGNRVRLEGVRFKVHSSTPRRFARLFEGFRVLHLESYDYSYIPILPLKYGACLLGWPYRPAYARLMAIFDHCRYIPSLRWFGKQLLAVCEKR